MKLIKRTCLVLIALLVTYLLVTQIAYWVFQYNLNKKALIRAKQLAAQIQQAQTNNLQQSLSCSNEHLRNRGIVAPHSTIEEVRSKATDERQ
jgi:capsular polysaccharide biosynthesis protein